MNTLENKNLLPQRAQRTQRVAEGASSALSVSSVVYSFRLPPSAFRPRSGISLIEVLISMFVLLFGLMGVAAIFPVGNHYVVEGEKFDLGSGVAQNAFEELAARGILRPLVWVYPFNSELTPQVTPFIVQTTQVGPPQKTTGYFNLPYTSDIGDQTYDPGPGHAFVIDPMGAISSPGFVDPTNLGTDVDLFPAAIGSPDGGTAANPWFNDDPILGPVFLGRRWPVRRLTLPVPDPLGGAGPFPMPLPVAETIFRLRDDLAVEQPDESDRPSIQRWDLADIDPVTGDPNDTPDDLSDDTVLRRQYKGNYSWLASIVPATETDRQALQPAHDSYGNIRYDVSIVVFRKRQETPSAESERLIQAELLQGGELVIYHATDKTIVDAAVEDIRPGSWISVMGVNQTTGAFVMKWYRILSLDEETAIQPLPSDGDDVQLRRLMLIGPDWPKPPTLANGVAIPNLRAGFLPGAISVVTKSMQMEKDSLWTIE